jgi:hypothetical protein
MSHKQYANPISRNPQGYAAQNATQYLNIPLECLQSVTLLTANAIAIRNR